MKEFSSLIGKTFGKLTVIEQASSNARGARRWVCQCECGNQTVVLSSNLTRGHTKSCGCIKQNDLTGKKIGSLTVLGRSDKYGSRGKRKTQLWECRCDCGAITYKATDVLTNPDISMCYNCAGKYALVNMRLKNPELLPDMWTEPRFPELRTLTLNPITSAVSGVCIMIGKQVSIAQDSNLKARPTASEHIARRKKQLKQGAWASLISLENFWKR